MRMLVFCLFVFAGQLNRLQTRPVIHLPPHKNAIEAGFDGSLLDLINAPSVIYLPALPPKSTQGAPWSVDVKNLGPGSVTVTASKVHFETEVMVGQTVHIYSNGTTYRLQR